MSFLVACALFLEGGNISAGMTLPEFTMAGPGSIESQKYLNLENQGLFTLFQIQARLKEPQHLVDLPVFSHTLASTKGMNHGSI
jgi:hypothetical protein